MSEFYSRFVKFVMRDGKQSYAHCPFHDDTNASFTVNEDKDAWYCHACGFGGHHLEFIERFYDVPKEQAQFILNNFNAKHIDGLPTQSYLDACQKSLRQRSDVLNVLKEWGMTDETLTRFQVGLDGDRLVFPIPSRRDIYINLRKYLMPYARTGNEAKVIGMRNCNDARFYPYENLTIDKQEVFIVEGEKDCLVGISQGLNCVTSTGGSNIPVGEAGLFLHKKVYVMVDNDKAGDTLRKKYHTYLKDVADEVIDIVLPEKDLTDYYTTFGDTDVLSFIKPSDLPTNVSASKAEGSVVDSLTLSESEHVDNMNRWFRLSNMSVIGADPAIYTVPASIQLTCTNSNCTRPCKLVTNKTTPSVPINPRQLLQFVGSSDGAQEQFARSLTGCKTVNVEPDKYVNVQKIVFQEAASFIDGIESSSFEPRYGLYCYEDKRLQATSKYDFVSCRVTDPRSQQNYYIIKEATQVKDNVLLDNDLQPAFQYMRSMVDNASLIATLTNHYKKWVSVLGIEQRSDLFGAILLTYLSVTEIAWNNGILKGWLDCLCIGDTRTGKSQMAQRFVKAIGLGSYINGENSKRTGVIGGVQRMGDSWIVTWGAIPLNDMGLLVIDEASGLEVDDIKELSATRSSGSVTINKIAKGEARARTRLLWFSNPRSGKNIEDFYWRGYGAFQEFIPIVEDQARYDVVISAAREDVKELKGIISSAPIDETELKYLRTVIQFAWSIPKDRITIDNPHAVAAVVKELAQDYSGGPLFVQVAAHEKILRLACAIAVLCGSVTGVYLHVTNTHIKWAGEFLKMTYDKASLDYKGFIEESRKAQKKASENTQFVRALMSQHPALKILLSANRFRGNQISEILGLDKTDASKILSELLQRGLIKISYNGTYQPDKLLVDIARQISL